MSFVEKIFGTFSDKELKKIRPIADKVLALEDTMAALTDDELKAKTGEFRKRLEAGETLDDILPEAFAVCREADWRVLGMKPFPVQVIGGIALHRCCIAEMQTGEGKTLVATLPVYLNALTGKGVHVVTVNDYLARRDSEEMGKTYRFLGLTVGLVTQDGTDKEDRRAAYAADVTYGTNNEFGFDYLRDNMVSSKANMVQRGHHYAIVDEVDSILVDEARTPLIISGKGDASDQLYQEANQFAKTLKKAVIVELDDKEDTDEQADGDYVVDEKHKTCTLTEDGIHKAEAWFHVENLSDPSNMELLHHINQAIRAHGVMQKDIDYVVKNGEVVIVDEFTGRLMNGRRYNEGLHQAIEAKEGVAVAAESKTLATITFQNYFRMYEKLSGMTGTASTEADEFNEIYGLNIVTVPTNKPKARQDLPDTVYKTMQAKYRAVCEQVKACHDKGQPVLVGTVSIEKSELISEMLKQMGVPHNVLNAKQHEKEAEIVAQAGKLGAVTIATNMAGRGTDITLGGNAGYMAKAQLRKEIQNQYAEAAQQKQAEGEDAGTEDYSDRIEQLVVESDGHADTTDAEILAARKRYNELLAQFKPGVDEEGKKVREVGGLYIIGTERHEARRIDNQLRGRAGRQGDPGVSRFFLSLEDDLMRIFGGDRIQTLMETMGVDEDTPLETRMLSNTIETAQKKLEARNFNIRKQVLSYDDVMNQQRTIIYEQRQKVLAGVDISEELRDMLKQSITDRVNLCMAGEDPAGWNFDALRRYYQGWLCTSEEFHFSPDQLKIVKPKDVIAVLLDRAYQILSAKEEGYGCTIMRDLERACLLRNVDEKWMNHIDAMEQLKKGITLRSYGQHDPVVEYRIEGFDMFDEMVNEIREDTIRMLILAEIHPITEAMA